MYHDGSNSARARSARIRAAHDDEATRLESMRRNAPAPRSARRRLPYVVLVLGLGAVAAPASHAAPSMCVSHTICGIARPSLAPAARHGAGALVVVVPVRADGSQHGLASTRTSS